MDSTRFLPLIGRIIIGLPFPMSGLDKLAGYAGVVSIIEAAGLPLAPLGWLMRS